LEHETRIKITKKYNNHCIRIVFFGFV